MLALALTAPGLTLGAALSNSTRDLPCSSFPVTTRRMGRNFSAMGSMINAAGRARVAVRRRMGDEERVARTSDVDVAQGVSFEAAGYDGPGRVHHLVHGEDSWLGPARGAVGSVAWLGELMTKSGLPTKVVADPRGAIWGKFIFNSVMNPVGAIVMGVNAARYDVPEMRALIDDMAAECIRVAEAQGIRLEFDPMYLVKKTRAGESPLTQHAGSMAQDLEAGRETELEAMTGYVVRKAKELGVPVPVTESVYRMARGVEYAARAKREGR